MIATVKYVIANGEGMIDVYCNSEDDYETIINKAKVLLNKRGAYLGLSMYSDSYKVISTRNEE